MEYITRECYDKLVAELNELMTVERPRIANAISEARDKGDLSENFEYHAAKREQGRLEGRIDHLKVVISNSRVIDAETLTTDFVHLLSRVTVKDLTHGGREMTFTIVSRSEADLQKGKISVNTPIARALMKRKAGDEVKARIPAGVITLRIVSISN